jgi:hypothetical protein
MNRNLLAWSDGSVVLHIYSFESRGWLQPKIMVAAYRSRMRERRWVSLCCRTRSELLGRMRTVSIATLMA